MKALCFAYRNPGPGQKKMKLQVVLFEPGTASFFPTACRPQCVLGCLGPSRISSRTDVSKNESQKIWQDMISSKMVTKLDGTAPTPAAISKAASEFGTEKKKRGRKLGQNKASKAEDRTIMKTFHKLRPPGQGVLWSPGLLPSSTKALQSRQYLSGHSLCNPFPFVLLAPGLQSLHVVVLHVGLTA